MQKVLLSVLLMSMFILVVGTASYIGYDKSSELPETNHEGLVKLHLAPNSETRDVTDKDKYTGVLLTDGINGYALFESRSLEKGDFGKTFVIPIN